MSDEPVAVRVVITGRVQGVGFRWSTQEEARRRGVGGWVRNRFDGSVEAWLEGAPPAVEGMLAWLERGPRSARVDRLERHAEPPEGVEAADFRVRSSSD